MIRTVEKTIVLKLIPLTQSDKNELYSLLEDYVDMLRFSLKKVIEKNIKSRKKAHQEIYPILRKKYANIHNKFIQEAYKKALSMYKSYLKLKRKKRKATPPRVRKKNVIDLHIDTFRIVKKEKYILLKLSKRSGDYLWFLIIPYERALKFINWEIKNSKIVVRRDEIYLHLTVRKQYEVNKHRNKLVIDINESSIDCLLYLEGKSIFFRVKHDIKELRLMYRELRKKRQEKYGRKAKLKFREKNRVKDRIKKITTLLAEIGKKFNADLVREDLKYLRDGKKKKSKELNYRLNSFAYHMIIQNLDYKFYERGLEVHTVNPSKTSITCPRCGYVSKKNRVNTHLFKCRKCGFTFDAQFNACINLLLRLDDGIKPREIINNILRWMPQVVGMTAPNEAQIYIDDVLREKSVRIFEIFKISKR